MKTIYIRSGRKIAQNKEELEKKLKVKLEVKGSSTTIEGKSEIDEYFAERVLKALDFPFTIDEALLLLKEDYLFEVINIKAHTKRKDLATIKGRIIGTEGKTLRVLQDLSESYIVVKDNNVAIIADSNNFENARQSVFSIIRGSKQANVYAYLEKANTRAKKF